MILFDASYSGEDRTKTGDVLQKYLAASAAVPLGRGVSKAPGRYEAVF